MLYLNLNTLMHQPAWPVSCLRSTWNALCHITTAHCYFSGVFLPFFSLEWDFWIVQAQNLSYQQHAVDQTIHLKAVITGHMSPAAIHSKEPLVGAQFAHIHQMQLLYEFCTTNVKMGNEKKEEVMLYVILYPSTTQTSTTSWKLIPYLKTVFLIFVYNKICLILGHYRYQALHVVHLFNLLLLNKDLDLKPKLVRSKN